jgi:tRNA dimethylallyltransferase
MTKLSKYDGKFIAIIGQTASGKSDLALKLAKKFPGVIVCADSRQVYKYMNIGTNKPTKTERQIVPHYGLDLVTPADSFTLADFLAYAHKAIKKIWHQGKLPIVVGGTGLYVTALVEGYTLSNNQPDDKVRKALNQKTTVELSAILKKLSPKLANEIDLRNRHRVIRTIEKISNGGLATTKSPLTNQVLQIGMNIDREILYQRINRRVDEMIKLGLIAEVKKLAKRYDWSLPAMSGIGYKQIGLWLNGGITKEQAIELIKRDTRHYAKRQMTWYHQRANIKWVVGIAEANRQIKEFLSK